MSYKVKPNWEEGTAFANAWDSMVTVESAIDINASEYFKQHFKIKLGNKILVGEKISLQYDIAEFEDEGSYMLFLLEWS